MEFLQIILGVKRKDPIKEKQLYQLLYQSSFKVALSYCSDIEEATGVFNYSVMDIFQNLKNFDSEASFLKWAYRVIQNDCLDHIRKKTVYKSKLNAVKKNSFEQLSFNEAVSNFRIQDIMQLIAKLSTDQRVCFVLYELEGYTHKEIASKLNININTSKWYLAEAKKNLRNMFSRSFDIIPSIK